MYAIVLSLGCYKYVPASMDAVPIGANVRAHLSTGSQIDLSSVLGSETRSVDAKLLDKNSQSVVLSVRSSAPRPGYQTLYQHVDIPRRDVLRFEIRQTDVAKTVGLAGLIGGAAAWIVVRLFEGGEPGRPESPTTQPEENAQAWMLQMLILSF
jgi:hypothetical protein